MRPAYDDNVFINCPFDEAYRPLFRALVFVVHACGMTARSALEVDNGAEVRIDKIARIIGQCRHSIHDISRTEPDAASGLPRMNMPFELGLFLGAKRYGPAEHQSKTCIIFDRERYRYQQFLSDIAGQDIRAHRNDPAELIRSVRNALATMRPAGSLLPSGRLIPNPAKHSVYAGTVRLTRRTRRSRSFHPLCPPCPPCESNCFPGFGIIRERYETFLHDVPTMCADLRLDPEDLGHRDLAEVITTWLERNPVTMGTSPSLS